MAGEMIKVIVEDDEGTTSEVERKLYETADGEHYVSLAGEQVLVQQSEEDPEYWTVLGKMAEGTEPATEQRLTSPHPRGEARRIR